MIIIFVHFKCSYKDTILIKCLNKIPETNMQTCLTDYIKNYHSKPVKGIDSKTSLNSYIETKKMYICTHSPGPLLSAFIRIPPYHIYMYLII